MTRLDHHVKHDSVATPSRPRASLLRTTLSAGRIALYMLALSMVLFFMKPSIRKEPVAFAIIAGSLVMLAFATFFIFGVLGYQITGDTLHAPRPAVWAFLFGVALVVLLSFLWIEGHNWIPWNFKH